MTTDKLPNLQDMTVKARAAKDLRVIDELHRDGHLSPVLHDLAVRFTNDVAGIVEANNGIAAEYQALSGPIAQLFKLLQGFVDTQAKPEIKQLAGEELRKALNGPQTAWYHQLQYEVRTARKSRDPLELLQSLLAEYERGDGQELN